VAFAPILDRQVRDDLGRVLGDLDDRVGVGGSENATPPATAEDGLLVRDDAKLVRELSAMPCEQRQ
jgi:hypothetical protein